MSPRRTTGHRQSGVALIGITLILLLVMSLLALYANRAIWLEQRTTSNQVRGKEALEVAEAGLEYMLAALNVRSSNTSATELWDYLSKDTTTGGYNIVSNGPLVGSPGTGKVFSTRIDLISGDAAPTKRFQLTSTGGSDCSNVTDLDSCQSRAIARVKIRITGLVANPPDSGLVVRGDTTLSGSSCVVNKTGSGKAIRTGQTVNSGGGAGVGGPTKGCTGSNTTILDTTQSPGECPALGTTGNSSCTDALITGLNGDQFFNLFFGTTKAEMKSAASIKLINTEPTEPANGEFVWVDITVTNFNIAGNKTYGSATDPVILILDGRTAVSGNIIVFGIVYVSGDLRLTGTLDIEGALIVEGEATVIGNAQVAKNQDVLNSLVGGMPPITKVMGSWKDW